MANNQEFHRQSKSISFRRCFRHHHCCEKSQLCPSSHRRTRMLQWHPTPIIANHFLAAPTSVQCLGLTHSNEEAKASGPFQWLLHDASDNINIKGYGEHRSVKLQILCLCKQPSMNTNTTKRRHEVLRSLIYKFKNRKAMWHWFFHSFFACYTNFKVVMNDAYLNEINVWVSIYEVGKFVMVLNADKVFDEIAKIQNEVGKFVMVSS